MFIDLYGPDVWRARIAFFIMMAGIPYTLLFIFLTFGENFVRFMGN
jgi:hypothetical protein